MATINHLETKNKLVLYDANLKSDEQKQRLLYLSPDLVRWFDDDLVYQGKDWDKYFTPIEQVEEVFDQFVRGHPDMGRGDMKKLNPKGKHVWQFKTRDVRILGYFYRKNVFIAVCGAMRKDLCPSSKYNPLKERIINFRKNIGLDEPLYMKEKLLDELISIQNKSKA